MAENPEDQVFCLYGNNNHPFWYCIVAGQTHGPWRDKGAALAGLATEQRRARARAQAVSGDRAS